MTFYQRIVRDVVGLSMYSILFQLTMFSRGEKKEDEPEAETKPGAVDEEEGWRAN